MTVYGPYPARVDEVHDGDTILLSLDLGFGHQVSSRDLDGKTWMACRVYGINAPELSNPDGSGKAARDFAKTLLAPGDRCQVMSQGWDKYGGRFLGSILMIDGQDYARVMIEAGHAVPYFGGAKP